MPAKSLNTDRHTPSTWWVVLMALFLISPSIHAQQNTDENTTQEQEQEGEFLGAMQTVYPDWFKTSFLEFEDDVAEASEAGKRLMLIFHQDGCPYCNVFVERNLAQKDIVETMQEKFDTIEINMWGDREIANVDGKLYTEKSFAEALKVQFTPTVLFLTETGDLSLRINGYYDPDRFRLALDYVSNKMEGEIEFSDFAKQHDGERSSGELIGRSYYTGEPTDLAKRPNKDTKPLLLVFEQKSCKNCELLHDNVMDDPESQKLLADFDVYQIDVWGREPFTTPDGQSKTGREWSAELGVNYAPTLVFYDKSGEEVIRSEAWFKTFHTQSMMDYVISGDWKEQPNFQRYISTRADEIRATGKSVNIWTNEPEGN